jgi:hypothetical protein
MRNMNVETALSEMSWSNRAPDPWSTAPDDRLRLAAGVFGRSPVPGELRTTSAPRWRVPSGGQPAGEPATG